MAAPDRRGPARHGRRRASACTGSTCGRPDAVGRARQRSRIVARPARSSATAADIGAVREDVRRAWTARWTSRDRLRRRDEAYPDRTGRDGSAGPGRLGRGRLATRATVLEVRAHDRPALLHRIGTALARAGVDVRAAGCRTLGAEAVDVFYVVGPTAARRERAPQRAVRAALR